MSSVLVTETHPTRTTASLDGSRLELTQRPRSISGGEESSMHNTVDRASVSGFGQDDGSNRPTVGLGARIWMSLARAKAVIIKDLPPNYTRGAWAIINDVPYPPPPPYAGSSRHPPTYDDAMEIGVVASPLRVEQLMHSRSQVRSSEVLLPRTASAPQLAALSAESTAPASREIEYLFPRLPAGSDAAADSSLPNYVDVDSTIPLSSVVRRWKLGEPAFEKPSRHPKGYQHPSTVTRNSSR
ncbi:hypothetical protein GGI11_001309 [Coemansia sp. RSA 2049]|nr:hypothetical protein GGI11_001309 [Coemansia sp. RSA 2049]